jgi:hypothetical protein
VARHRDAVRSRTMRSSPLVLVALLAALAGCGLLPSTDYGPPAIECVRIFEPDVKLEWAGQGDASVLGLMQPHTDLPQADLDRLRVGDIYVGRADPAGDIAPASERAYCLVAEDAVLSGPVPEGWQPP